MKALGPSSVTTRVVGPQVLAVAVHSTSPTVAAGTLKAIIARVPARERHGPDRAEQGIAAVLPRAEGRRPGGSHRGHEAFHGVRRREPGRRPVHGDTERCQQRDVRCRAEDALGRAEGCQCPGPHRDAAVQPGGYQPLVPALRHREAPRDRSGSRAHRSDQGSEEHRAGSRRRTVRGIPDQPPRRHPDHGCGAASGGRGPCSPSRRRA